MCIVVHLRAQTFRGVAMKTTARILIAVMLVCAPASFSFAGSATKVDKVKVACMKEAKVKKIARADRKAFMKECAARPA
jgi:hypothetical protein